jgi:hypothetical protein
MAKHVFSTLNASTAYTDYTNHSGVNTPIRRVLVHGGAGVAQAAGAGVRVFTPQGVRTEITDEEAAFLQKHPDFIEHQKRGHVRIENTARDPDKVAEKMDLDEGSKPKTAADVAKFAADAAKKSGLKPDETLQVASNKGRAASG